VSGASGGSAAPSASVTTEELLAAADQLLTSPVPGLGNLWPRVCALLIRLALELTLDRYWARVLPEAAGCGMRQQLLLLPLYAGAASGPGPVAAEAVPDLDAVSLAREAWLGLAGAAHHHAYELAPNAAELRGWHTAVSQLTAMLTAHVRLPRETR
jgi:hypothetical protein